jgi:hypothetical protein
MRISLRKPTVVRPREDCNSQVVGDLLPDYIADMLRDSRLDTFEEHLLDCKHCQHFLLMFFAKQIPSRSC